MNYNVVKEYIDYVTNSYYKLFKLLLGKDYNKSLIRPFLEKYIDVRYYGNTIYSEEKNFVERIGKELLVIVKELIKINQDKEEVLKNIYALFGYIIYYDDAIYYDDLNELNKTLLEDKVITLNYDDATKKEFKEMMKDFVEKKKMYFELFESNQFILEEKRIKLNTYEAYLEQNVRVSKLYSDYAINKAFNSGVVNEDKYFVLYTMLAVNILKGAIDLDYSRQYIVEFPESLFLKDKKCLRLIDCLDDELVKSHVSLKITYSTYLKFKSLINSIISKGYKIAVVLDDSFDNNLEGLILFSYVLLYQDAVCYDMIIESKDKLKANLVLQ